MTDDPKSNPPQQVGCSVVNLAVPLFAALGIILGWQVGSRAGIGYGVLGGVVGLVLAMPLMGLTLTLLVGVLFLVEWLRGGKLW